MDPDTVLAAPWDVQVQRFHIALAPDARVAPIAGVALADVTEPPSDGWLVDGEDAYAFEQGEGWYAYDVSTHVLTPREIVWVLETTEGNYLALEIVDYYDDAGTSGYFTWHWAALAAGGGS